jgi:hypothetical protein
MRKILIGALTFVCLLAIYSRLHGRPVGQGDNCYGHNILDIPIAARAIFKDNVTNPGTHVAIVDHVSAIIINPSPKWGGGKVTIPEGYITAELGIRELPNETHPVAETGAAPAHAKPLRYQITSVNGGIKSFLFPRNVVTGLNSFSIIPEKSYVLVHGSSGKAKITGEAQAWLTNAVFRRSTPARVRVSFWGNYDFDTKVVTFTRFEAHAHSRG